MLLSLKDLRICYEKVEAVKGICMEVEEGTVVTLIGSNGAGKTTTLRAISGLKVPASGEIWFLGKRIDGWSPAEIVKLGIAHVPQGRRPFPYMTVLENLKLGAFLRKDRDKISRDMEEVFEHFPILKERKQQQAGSLSGGEQQMLAIGRSLMASPKLLLLDEPSLGLAPLLVTEITKIIKDINQRGVSIILVEQNARMAFRVAHKGYVLEVGNIVLEGDTKSLAADDQVKKAYLGG